MSGRPKETVERPKHVAIRDQIVRCRHAGCHHQAGPFHTRDEAARAARAHWLAAHSRSGRHAE